MAGDGAREIESGAEREYHAIDGGQNALDGREDDVEGLEQQQQLQQVHGAQDGYGAEDKQPVEDLREQQFINPGTLDKYGDESPGLRTHWMCSCRIHTSSYQQQLLSGLASL